MFTKQRNKSLNHQSTGFFHPTQSSVAAGSAHDQGTLGIAIFGQTPRQKAQLHQAQPAMFAAQTRSLSGSSCLVGCNRGYVRGISWVNQSTYNPAYGLLAKWDDPPKKINIGFHQQRWGRRHWWLTHNNCVNRQPHRTGPQSWHIHIGLVMLLHNK